MVKHQTGNYRCHPCCKTREADAPKLLMAQKQAVVEMSDGFVYVEAL